MQQQLNELQPLLAEKTQATEQLLAQVQHEQEEAEQVASVVASEEADVAARAAETAALKDEAAADLAVVLPALEAATKALDALNKADIIEMKTFMKPPALVQLTMEAVCTLLQEKTDWDSAIRVLGDAGFIKRLIDFDKNNIPERVTRALKKIISEPSFTPELVGKQSKAAMSMCLWVGAVDTYATVYKIVEPKRQVLAAAQDALDASNKVLAEKQTQLKEIRDKVKVLQQQLLATRAELSSLEQQVGLSQKRLGRAGKLTALLGSEAGRWEERTFEISRQLEVLVGDAFLSAACISYQGAFTGPYRAALMASWQQQCMKVGIPFSGNFSLASMLASPVELREWAIQGLPSDLITTQNAIMATRGDRWPLMIDPQDQANRWVKAMEGKAGLVALRSGDPHLLRALEACVRIGSPVLLEGCGEVLDPGLVPLLGKKTSMHGNSLFIRLGDSDVDYDPNFKLYMTTRLANPHFLPETCIQVNLVNFTVTRKGLEDQLLGELVRQERPELEEQRDRLVVSIAADKRQLKELEDKVLKLLKEASGNILDDEYMINTLNNAKTASGIIQSRVREAEETERQINSAREEYRAAPGRASLLWFVIADLPQSDPMYQYSLSYFCTLFKLCIKSAPASNSLVARLDGLIGTMTTFMYRMVCRGLFDAHRLIFSLLIALSIQRDAGMISELEWEFFIRGGCRSTNSSVCGASGSSSMGSWSSMGTSLDSDSSSSTTATTTTSSSSSKIRPESAPSWLPEHAWQGLTSLGTAAPIFKGLPAAIASDPQRWHGPLMGDEVWSKSTLDSLAQQWGAPTPLTAFQRLLLTKVLQEDALPEAFRDFICRQLGSSFLDPPATNLSQVFQDSAPSTPIIFIMWQGTDPMAALTRFAKSMGRSVGQGLHLISLGQGQGTVAEGVVHVAMKAGEWVCLQNCHLAKSWMPRLQALVEELSAAAAAGAAAPNGEAQQLHPDFRLWLTSMPASYFPVPVLQLGVKVTLEPPKGLRANMLRSYTSSLDSSLAACDPHGCGPEYRRTVYVITFLHAVMQERRKFGPLGWNIPYDFSDADLSCALQTMQLMMIDAAASRGHGSGAAALQSMIGRAQEAGSSSSSSHIDGRSWQPSMALPWPALQYILGQITYGGRVTDEQDRRLLACLMQQHLQPGSLQEKVLLTASGQYFLPPDGDLPSYQSHVRALPLLDEPQVLGFGANASLAFNRQEARRIMDAVLLVQPNAAAGAEHAGSRAGPMPAAARPSSSSKSASSSSNSSSSSMDEAQQAVAAVVGDLLTMLPAELKRDEASLLHDPFMPLSRGQVNSLGVILQQEIDRYNALLALVRSSLEMLAGALAGLVVMSAELEQCCSSIRNQQVPSAWSMCAYPSTKPLGSWVQDLARRVAFLRDWLSNGVPTSFWLPGFFFPQGFLTAVLQNHARNTRTPIDRLQPRFHTCSELAGPAAVSKPPPEGVYIHGLFLEAARWDPVAGLLCEALPKVVFSPLPVIRVSPVDALVGMPRQHPLQQGLDKQQQQQQAIRRSDHVLDPVAENQRGWYACPLYKTSQRAGVLSTRGTSTNFITYLEIPTRLETPSSFWVQRGVAALCALDD